jgi:hypothetical protein
MVRGLDALFLEQDLQRALLMWFWENPFSPVYSHFYLTYNTTLLTVQHSSRNKTVTVNGGDLSSSSPVQRFKRAEKA